MRYKYTDAYNSVKAPAELKAKVLNTAGTQRRFNYKSLISVAACVIILAVVLPTYVGLTAPTVTVAESAPMAVRYMGMQIPLEFSLDRSTKIEVSSGTLDGYDGDGIKGRVSYVWCLGDEAPEGCTVTLKDALKTTVYVLNYNEKNDSWSIIKN